LLKKTRGCIFQSFSFKAELLLQRDNRRSSLLRSYGLVLNFTVELSFSKDLNFSEKLRFSEELGYSEFYITRPKMYLKFVAKVHSLIKIIPLYHEFPFTAHAI
jgi:hypothetical protein